jgi:uncharacterized membrane protein
MNAYMVFKLVHILAVIVFLGNVFTGLFWMHHAHKTKNILIINHAFKGLIISDRYFTIPGVVIIVAGGFASAIQAHYPILRTGWIFWSIVAFTLSGVAFSSMLGPLQKKIYRLTLNAEAATNFDWTTYNRLYKAWEIWGLVAIITPFLALIMMVMKWPSASIF